MGLGIGDKLANAMHVPLVHSGQTHPLSIHLCIKKYGYSNYRELRSRASLTTIVAQKYHFWKTLLYNNNWKFEIGSPSHINEDTIF
jgi:hypothetical protein